MSWLSAGAAVPAAALPEDHAFIDFELVQTVTGATLVAVTSPAFGGGVVSISLREGLAPQSFDHTDLTGIGPRLYQPGVSLAALAGQDILFVSGQGGAAIGGFTVDAAGAILAPVTFTATDGLISQAPSALAVATFGKSTFAFVGDAVAGGIRSYAVSPTRVLTLVDTEADTAQSYLADVTEFAIADTGSAMILLSISGTEHGIMSHRIDPLTGQLTEAGRMGSQEGLGVGGLTWIETVSIGGQTYAVVAGTNSSSLTVLRVAADGALSVTDHLIDSLDSRFGTVSAIDIVQAGGWTFVVAGGGDDGISLFALLADGTLVHLQSIADTTALTLDNIAGLAATVVGNELQVIASSNTEPGLSYFTMSLSDLGVALTGTAADASLTGGAQNDLIQGGAGSEVLRGNAGRDVIKDGAGADTIFGGSGADIFVLAADGSADVIQDFQPGEDRLDLSAWTMLYNTGQLGYTQTATGAILTYRGEVLTINSLAGTPLTLGQIFPAGIEGPYRPPLVLSEVNFQLFGTAGNDVLTGGNGDDLIEGREGADTLDGGAGNDTIRGEAGEDLITGGDGNDEIDGGAQWDTIWGGAGNDTVTGGLGSDRIYLGDGDDVFFDSTQNDWNGADWISGGAGRDTIWGAGGADTIDGGDDEDLLYGGENDDWIDGGAQNDTIHAEAGNDVVWGGFGADTIYLGTGNDRYNGNTQGGIYGNDWIDAGAGRDTVDADGGNDTIFGGDGEDLITGGAGDDWIDGGGQYDTIWGGAGNDTVRGGLGSDHVYLNEGDDVFFDEPQQDANGRDWVEGGHGNDTIYGGGGNDTLFGGAGNDWIDGGNQYDTIHGGAGNDTVYGGGGADLVYLNDGNDIFHDNGQSGIHGRDKVYAGPGNDTIHAGGGDDIFYGEAGADTFVFTTGAGSDVIMDFLPGVDMIAFNVPGLAFDALVITGAGSDAVIDFGADRITLTDVDFSILTIDHFNFL